MDKKIPSLNDLSINLHLINKKYKIKDFIEEYREEISKINDILRQELVTSDGLTNPVQKVVQISQLLTEEELDQTIQVVEKLTHKYDYTSYIEECETIRKNFMVDRENYFAVKATKSQAKIVDEVTTIFELTGTSEMIFSKWLDKILEKIQPKTLEVDYEDIDGRRKKAKVKHKFASMSDDYVEAPLIDRYHGINAYDSFLLHSFFDVYQNKWIYIPVKLIVSLKCEEDIEDIDVGEEKR